MVNNAQQVQGVLTKSHSTKVLFTWGAPQTFPAAAGIPGAGAGGSNPCNCRKSCYNSRLLFLYLVLSPQGRNVADSSIPDSPAPGCCRLPPAAPCPARGRGVCSTGKAQRCRRSAHSRHPPDTQGAFPTLGSRFPTPGSRFPTAPVLPGWAGPGRWHRARRSRGDVLGARTCHTVINGWGIAFDRNSMAWNRLCASLLCLRQNAY